MSMLVSAVVGLLLPQLLVVILVVAPMLRMRLRVRRMGSRVGAVGVRRVVVVFGSRIETNASHVIHTVSRCLFLAQAQADSVRRHVATVVVLSSLVLTQRQIRMTLEGVAGGTKQNRGSVGHVRMVRQVTRGVVNLILVHVRRLLASRLVVVDVEGSNVNSVFTRDTRFVVMVAVVLSRDALNARSKTAAVARVHALGTGLCAAATLAKRALELANTVVGVGLRLDIVVTRATEVPWWQALSTTACAAARSAAAAVDLRAVALSIAPLIVPLVVVQLVIIPLVVLPSVPSVVVPAPAVLRGLSYCRCNRCSSDAGSQGRCLGGSRGRLGNRHNHKSEQKQSTHD